MLYNTDKCHHVHIGENTTASKYEMGSGNESTIKRVESEQDLGVFIDGKLNFHEQITKKLNITNRNLNSVQKLCGTGFSQFPLLYVVLGPTSL